VQVNLFLLFAAHQQTQLNPHFHKMQMLHHQQQQQQQQQQMQ
jgi:hypothetical protein